MRLELIHKFFILRVRPYLELLSKNLIFSQVMIVTLTVKVKLIFSIPMLRKDMFLAQARGLVNPSIHLGCLASAIPWSTLSSQCWSSIMTSTPRSSSVVGIAVISARLPIVKLPCLDSLQWRLEQISSKSSNLCSKQFEGKR